jgi:hypothetical protein
MASRTTSSIISYFASAKQSRTLPETSQLQSLEQADESQRRYNDQPDYGEGNDQPDHGEGNYYMVEGGNEADDEIIDEDEQDIPCETVKRKGAPAIEKVKP